LADQLITGKITLQVFDFHQQDTGQYSVKIDAQISRNKYDGFMRKIQIKLIREIISALLLTLSFLPFQLHADNSLKGDIKNGQSIAAEKCDRCHGSGGVSSDVDTPSLASQSAAYTLKQINDYKNKTREDKNMYKRVRKLNGQQMTDLSFMV
jgi:cytochrome c553